MVLAIIYLDTQTNEKFLFENLFETIKFDLGTHQLTLKEYILSLLTHRH